MKTDHRRPVAAHHFQHRFVKGIAAGIGGNIAFGQAKTRQMRRQQPMPSRPLLGIDRLRAVGEKIEIVGRIPNQTA